MSRKAPKLETKIQNNIGVQAADWTPARAWINYPLQGAAPECSSWALERIWRRARSLACNCPEIRHAVSTLVMMTGQLTPRPCSSDEAWNKRAREAFLKRVNNPNLFDACGVHNWQTAQNFLERRAIIDGDALTVLTTAKDGGGSVQFYAAPQITATGDYKDGKNSGVEVDPKTGRVKGYHVYDYNAQKSFFAASNRAILYRHNPEVGSYRGASELVAAIATAQDHLEICGATKAGIKAAAIFGLVETTDGSARNSFSDLAALRNPARVANGNNDTPTPATATPSNALPVRVDGAQAISLSPGHRLETIHDSRPSNETQNFLKSLVNALAYSVGLDPVLLYECEKMGSASTRFILAKARDIVEQRLQDRLKWANTLWQFIVSCEVKAGRLDPCPADDWASVKWVHNSAWTIDRSASNDALNLIRAGLMSADDYTLSQCGKTAEEIFAENLHATAHNIERAKAAGVDYYLIAAPQSGATIIPDKVDTPKKEESADDDGLLDT